MTTLPWPLECSNPNRPALTWSQVWSNICLDFHGDPYKADWIVYSDGNHHMALEKSLQAFVGSQAKHHDIFYVTLPPHILIEGIIQGGIRLGNLLLSRKPDIFIGPDIAMQKLKQYFPDIDPHPFKQSRGNVLLVPKSNVKNIQSLKDLLRQDIRIFISNPITEKASYEVYRQSLIQIAEIEYGQGAQMQDILDGTRRMIFGERVHHRELPQFLANGLADVALVYYHLAKRYLKIFPEQFRMIYIGDEPEHPGNIITQYYFCKLPGHRPDTDVLIDHLKSKKVTDIYCDHGLQDYLGPNES